MLSTSLSVLALLAAGASAAPAAADSYVPSGTLASHPQADVVKRDSTVDLSHKLTDPDWDYFGCVSAVMNTQGHSTAYYGPDGIPYWSVPAGQRTGQSCLDYAVARGYNIMGTYASPWDNNCFFGKNGLLQIDQNIQLSPEQCTSRCANDQTKNCGEGGFGDVYIYNPKPKGPQFIQSYSSGSTKWTRSGCQSDLLYGTRALPNLLAQTADQTVEACLDACTSAGYTQCGVEYHGECWGGNALDKTSQALSDESCNLLCADNALEYCGGNGGPSRAAFQLFTTPSKPVVSTTTTAAPVASPTPTLVKSYKTSGKKGKTFTRKGCQSDLLYGTRALPNLLAQTANQTVEACLEACATNKYSLCGVEYKGECWGANKLDSTSQALDDSACNLPCADNSLEYCGGTGGPSGSAFQLFSASPPPFFALVFCLLTSSLAAERLSCPDPCG
ncbi:hypothetical protein JCM8097_002679 [Rhodosporidiobolus ruineniae]